MVDTYLNVDGQPSLLRIETNREGDQINKPNFL